MASVMQNLAFAASFASFLFACHLWIVRPAQRAAVFILGAFFLVLSLQTALLGLLLEFGRDHWWTFIRPTLAMMIGPIAWIYLSSAAAREFRPRLHHGLHFLPALFIAFQMLAKVFVVDIDLAIITSFAVYAAAVAWKARLGPAQFADFGDRAGDVYRWLLAAIALLVFALVAEIAIVADIHRGRHIGESPAVLVSLVLDLVLIGTVLLTAMRRPSPFDWMIEMREAAFTSSRPSYTEAEYRDCIARFEALIAKEKLHLEADITVRTVARKLGVSPRLLSEAVNRSYGESYSRRMNRLRVEDAKRLLRENEGMSITEVMFESGFRTKSSFNREFRALAGETPSAFRERAVS